MNKNRLLLMALSLNFSLISCSEAVADKEENPEGKEFVSTKKEPNENENKTSSEDENKEQVNAQDKDFEEDIEFTVLKVDGMYPGETIDWKNYDYFVIFKRPTLITTEEGKKTIQERYTDFYNDRHEYLDMVDLTKNYILLLTLHFDAYYSDFQAKKLSVKGDKLKIYYSMIGIGDDWYIAGGCHFTHVIFQVPMLDNKITEVQMDNGICDINLIFYYEDSTIERL